MSEPYLPQCRLDAKYPSDDFDAESETASEYLKRKSEERTTTNTLRAVVAFFILLFVVVSFLLITSRGVNAYPQPPRTVVTVEPKYELIGYGLKDADTLLGNIRVGFDIQLQAQDMRARDYDAWESHKYRKSAAVDGAISDAEVLKGKKATAELQEWIGNQRVFISCDAKRDNYGRWLVSFYKLNNDGSFSSFKDWMAEHGHVRSNLPETTP